MLWVYGQYKDFYSYSAGSDFKADPRAVRVEALNFFMQTLEAKCVFFNLKSS